jgi:hypothetical protein
LGAADRLISVGEGPAHLQFALSKLVSAGLGAKVVAHAFWLAVAHAAHLCSLLVRGGVY